MKKLLYALLATGLVACGKNDSQKLGPNQLMANDFEAIDGWAGTMNSPSLTKEKAHSGRYALKVGPDAEYSLGYDILLGKLSPSKLKKIKVTAWGMLPNGHAAATLAVILTDPATPDAKPLMWEGLDLNKEIKTYNKWVKLEKTITLPENASYAHRFTIYLWRTEATETAYLDDILVEKVD